MITDKNCKTCYYTPFATTLCNECSRSKYRHHWLDPKKIKLKVSKEKQLKELREKWDEIITFKLNRMENYQSKS